MNLYKVVVIVAQVNSSHTAVNVCQHAAGGGAFPELIGKRNTSRFLYVPLVHMFAAARHELLLRQYQQSAALKHTSVYTSIN